MAKRSKILVIKLGALGDIILAMESFQAIRRHHPEAEIHLLTRKPFAALARSMPWFDEIWTDPAPKIHNFRTWLALGKKLRQRAYERVYDLQCNDRTGFYYRLLGRRKPEWVGKAPGCSHPRPDFRGKSLSVPEQHRQMLERAGIPRGPEAALDWLDGPLDDFALPDPFVLLIPGCAPHRPYKRWPADRYGELALRLQDDGFGSVVIGTAAEAGIATELLAVAPDVVNLAGKTDIGQIAALARRAAGVVGNDTGPVHIAAIVQAPTLVLMSKVTDPVKMLPAGPDVGWLKKDDLTDLTVEEVRKAIRFRKP